VGLAVLALVILVVVSSAPVAATPASQAVWGVPSSRFRTGFVLSNPTNATQESVPVFVYLQFPWGELVSAYNELSVTDSSQNPVSSTVLCQTTRDGFVVGACVMVVVSMSAGQTGTYFAYYGNPASLPSVPSPIKSSFGAPGFTASRFSSLDFNYTFMSTFTLGYSSYLSVPGAPREGGADLGGSSFDNILQSFQLLPGPFSSNATVVATAIANDSGVLLVRAMVGSSGNFRLVDFVVNQRGAPLGGASLTDFYDLSHLSPSMGGSAEYSVASGTLTDSAGEAVFKMSSNPLPSQVDLGTVSSVLTSVEGGTLVPSDSASGKIGLAAGYVLPYLPPLSAVELERDWALVGTNPSATKPPVMVGTIGQESLDSSIPSAFAGYEASIILTQKNLTYLTQSGHSLNFTVSNNQASVDANALSLGGQIEYALPNAGDANFSVPNDWHAEAGSTSTADAFASDKYWSPAQQAYTGLVSISSTNSSQTQTKGVPSSATLSTSPLSIPGQSDVTLHLTYRALDTVTAPGNQTALDFAVGIDSLSNGVIDKTVLFPVSGIAPKPSAGKALGDLTGDGAWHQMVVNLTGDLPMHNFEATLTLNATSSSGDKGSVLLQVTGAYLEVHSPASDVLSATGHGTKAGWTVQVLNHASNIGYLSPATLDVKLWIANPLTTSNGDEFNAGFGALSLTNSVSTRVSIEAQRILVLGPNSSLSASYLNGAISPATPTPGGYVIDQNATGPLSVRLDYSGVSDYKIAVVDASGLPIPATLTVSDLYQNRLLSTTVQSAGAFLHVLPGQYVVTATFDGYPAGSLAVDTRSSSGATLHTLVYHVGFHVTDILNGPISNVVVSLNSSAGYSTSALTDAAGHVSFEIVANEAYSVTVSSGGSTLANEGITASTDGEVISISTTYTPTWAFILSIALVVSALVLAASMPRILTVLKGRRT
jgi:hypothetical protein